MNTFLISLFCVSSVSSTTIFGKDKCTEGPTYWCQNAHTAKECGALRHCVTVWKNNEQSTYGTVWKNEQLNGTRSCAECKRIIKDLKLVLRSSLVKSAIQALAVKACILIKEPTAEEVCDVTIALLVPQVLHLIEYEMRLKSSKLQCQLCESGVAELRDTLKIPIVQQTVKSLIKNVCPHLGTWSVGCHLLVDEYIHAVFNFLIKELNPQLVCGTLGFCKSGPKTEEVSEIQLTNGHEKSSALSLPRASIGCVVCEFVIKVIDEILGANRTKAEIEEAFDKVCHILPSAIKTECDQFVALYTSIIIKGLEQGLQPKEICSEIRLCR